MKNYLATSLNVMFLCLLLLTSCKIFRGGGGGPAPGAPDLIVTSRYVPTVEDFRKGYAKIDWVEYVSKLPKKIRKFIPEPADEIFPVSLKELPDCNTFIVYKAEYNLSEGRNATDREAECVDRRVSYLMFDVLAIIDVVTYLKQYVFTKMDEVYEFLF